MATKDLETRLERRLRRAGLTLDPAKMRQLAAYFGLLAKWNRQINLTSLALEPASDEAIDRLLVEPVAASAVAIQPSDRLLIDLGSGGGSPAIPLKVVSPAIGLVMIEAKSRKAAFLRDAARQLGLGHVEVAASRFEELLTRVDLHEAADLVSIRAVRADRSLWGVVHAFLRPGGRVIWFTSNVPKRQTVEPPLSLESLEQLLPKAASYLAVLRKTA